MDAKYHSLEVDERSTVTDLEAVKYSNQALMDRNLDLKSEMEALQKHSLMLNQQNQDLQRELDSFVETDDIVRRNLDRKEKISQIRYNIDHHVGLVDPVAAAVVHRSRSPIRRGSPLREVVEHHEAIRSRSPYAPHYVPHPAPATVGMGLGGPAGPLRREYSPTRKENLVSYPGMGSFGGIGAPGRLGSLERDADLLRK